MAILRSATRRSSSPASESGNVSDRPEYDPPNVSPLQGPNVIASKVSEQMLEGIRSHFRFLDKFSLVAAEAGERVNLPPEKTVSLYIEHLKAGLRFPIPVFFLKVFQLYRLVPSQLTPNSIRVLCAFMVICHETQVEPTLSLFVAMFLLKRDSRGHGWWMFSPRSERKLISGLPSAIHGWKEGFFFIRSSSPWEISSAWSLPNFAPNDKKDISMADSLRFAKLQTYRHRPLRELLSENNLCSARLSSFADLGIALII